MVNIVVPRDDPPGTEETIHAFLTLTPGLVVNRALRNDRWCVTHQRSGLVVAVTADPESAMMVSARLASVTDWTRSAADIHTAGIHSYDIRAVVGDAVAEGREPGELVDRNALV